MDTPSLANDKYRATLRSLFVDGVDTSLNVTAIPTNLPTIVVVGWETDYETKFRVEGTSGTNSSNYALTGITKIAGYTGNIPENSAVNCLNVEDFFNQWGTQIAAVQQTAEDAAVSALTVTTAASSAEPSPTITTTRNLYRITALAAAAELQPPTGTPTDGMSLIVSIKDNSTVRALTYDAIYRAIGVQLPTTTVDDKTLYLGMIYNLADDKWDVLAVQQEL